MRPNWVKTWHRVRVSEAALGVEREVHLLFSYCKTLLTSCRNLVTDSLSCSSRKRWSNISFREKLFSYSEDSYCTTPGHISWGTDLLIHTSSRKHAQATHSRTEGTKNSLNNPSKKLNATVESKQEAATMSKGLQHVVIKVSPGTDSEWFPSCCAISCTALQDNRLTRLLPNRRCVLN